MTQPPKTVQVAPAVTEAILKLPALSSNPTDGALPNRFCCRGFAFGAQLALLLLSCTKEREKGWGVRKGDPADDACQLWCLLEGWGEGGGGCRGGGVGGIGRGTGFQSCLNTCSVAAVQKQAWGGGRGGVGSGGGVGLGVGRGRDWRGRAFGHRFLQERVEGKVDVFCRIKSNGKVTVLAPADTCSLGAQRARSGHNVLARGTTCSLAAQRARSNAPCSSNAECTHLVGTKIPASMHFC